MLRSKKMKKARIIVLKSIVEKLLKDLHEAGLVDIRKTKYEGLDEGRPLSSFDEISTYLLEFRSLRTTMEKTGQKSKKVKPIDGKEALEQARNFKVGERLKELSRESTKLSEEGKALSAQLENIVKLVHFKGVNFAKLGTKTINYKVGEVSKVKRPSLERKIERSQIQATVVNDPRSDGTLILYEKKNEAAMDSLLSEFGFNEIELPEGMTTPVETANKIKGEKETVKKKLNEVKKEISEISKENYEKVVSLIASLEIEAERAKIASRFASSKTLYVLEGWILEEDFPKLEDIVSKYPDNVMLADVEYSHDELPPTVLDNPKIASPFEFLTKSYSLPNYHELDPTIPYMIGLPIIYGMIVGDFIYGIISIFLGLLLMKKFEKSYVMYNVSKIWFYSGFATLLFGIAFDEWGGMSHVMLLESISKWIGIELITEPLYSGFHRMHNILTLVGLSALLGMIHLAAGFAIGAINEWHHNKKHSIAKIAWIGVEFGMILALAPAIGIINMPELITAGIVLLVICIITLWMTEGILGIIEIPGLIGNILSYSRIAAIGIVGVVIAELLNEFIMPVPEQGIFAIILIPIFFALHVANAFIAMFESLVQGGRLNIVEFRSKFLHGGGEVFVPFAIERGEMK